ncbi:MAG TPA: hypothetical protein VMY34_09025 [Acidimicrobiales bacterium]|nr:hypothetical protein [Acidimicrobiales bacterium]
MPRPKAGNARTGPLPLHPMTVADIFDGAFKLLKANARSLFVIVLVLVGPAQVLAAFATRGLLGGESFLTAFTDPTVIDSTAQTQSFWEAAASFLAVILQLLLLPFIGGAISRVVAASYLGEELAPGPALRAVFRRGGSLFAAFLLVHVAELLPFLVLGIVGIVLVAAGAFSGGAATAVGVIGFIALVGFGGLWAVAAMPFFVVVAPAVVVEDLGPIRSCRRSIELVRRRYWPVLGMALLSGLVASMLGNMLGIGPQIVAALIGFKWGWIIVAAGGIFVSLVVTPFVAIVATLLYFDLRIRTEGFDLAVIAANLGPAGDR